MLPSVRAVDIFTADTQQTTNAKGETMTATATKIDNGNNETLARGITQNNDGTYTAVTFSASKTFKTYAGAVKWLANRIR